MLENLNYAKRFRLRGIVEGNDLNRKLTAERLKSFPCVRARNSNLNMDEDDEADLKGNTGPTDFVLISSVTVELFMALL